MNPQREKLEQYVSEELESTEYVDDVATVLPDYEAEELGDGDATTANPEGHREAMRRAASRAHEYALQKARERAQDRLDDGEG